MLVIWTNNGIIDNKYNHAGPCTYLSMKELGTVEPRYNEVIGTMKMTLLYQVSHYIRVKE